ncbi:MAG: glycosyltransferase family 4 protein [Cyclobacteriaceae bacterium]
MKYGLQERTQYFYNPKSKSVKSVWEGLNYALKHIGNVSFLKAFLAIKAIFGKKVVPLFAFNYVFLEGIEDLDILHAHFGEMGVFAAKMKKAGFLNKPKIVVSFHGHDIFPYKKKIYKKEYRIFETYSDALLVNSEYSKNLLLDIISNKKIIKVPVGLNLAYFKPNERDLEKIKIRIIFLGRLVHLKGGLLMIDIFYRLSKNNSSLELVIIGDGEKRNKIENKIKEYGLVDSVVLKGALSQDQVISEFKSSSIYVYPGLFDPFFQSGDTQGLVVQEAQAMELPVVCSDIGGIKYGMVDGETGILVGERDIDGFVEKIQMLLDNPELRRKMGKAGREFVQKNFDSKVIGDRLIGVYQNILHEN